MPSPSAASTLAKPVVTAPALLAMASDPSASRSSIASTSAANAASARTLALKPRANAPLLAARFTSSAEAVTQTPRPGNRRRMSGTTVSSGPTTKRIIASGGPLARVTMQVRWGPVSSLSMKLRHSERSAAEIRNRCASCSEEVALTESGFACGAPERRALLIPT